MNSDDEYKFLSKSRAGALERQKFMILIRGSCSTSSEDVLLGRYQGDELLGRFFQVNDSKTKCQ
jgi:hypothetical protein